METPEAELLDPSAAMDLIHDTQTKTRRALDVNGSLLYGMWGLAWLTGYLALWFSLRDQHTYLGPSVWALVVMGVSMAAALAVTVVTMARAVQGVAGLSSMSARLYGWSWFIGFASLYAIVVGLSRAGANASAIGLLAAAGPVLVVSIMYLVGGALWHYPTMFVVGAWLAVANGVAVMFGVVTFDVVMAVAGGGGFLAAALYEARRRRA